MIARELFVLAARGYTFPQPNTFKSVAPTTTTPRSFPTVRVRITQPHYQLRRLLKVGEVVNLPEPDAADAVALGRAIRV